MGDAARQVSEVLLDILGVPSGGPRADDIRARVTTRLTARVDLAWQLPAERLDEAAEEALTQLAGEEGHRVARVGVAVPGRDPA